VSRFEAYLERHQVINFSIITYYEILSGLKH
jgi:tRNA(fMet)-specific endonuclease VapC